MKLYESLFIMHKCITNVNAATNGMTENLSNSGNIEQRMIFTNYILMESVSFLDEFHNVFTKVEPEYHHRVSDISTLIQPILERIHRWTDLTKFRNNIVAHKWRNRTNEIVIPDPNKYNVPRNWFEMVMLSNLMNYIFQLIDKEFGHEINEMIKYMHKYLPIDKPPTGYQAVNDDHTAMAEEVGRLCQQRQKTYHLMITLYILPGQ